MAIIQGKRNSMKPHTRQGKNPNPFKAEVKSTETSYSNPSIVVCCPQCSLSRVATQANSRQVLGEVLASFHPELPIPACMKVSIALYCNADSFCI